MYSNPRSFTLMFALSRRSARPPPPTSTIKFTTSQQSSGGRWVSPHTVHSPDWSNSLSYYSSIARTITLTVSIRNASHFHSTQHWVVGYRIEPTNHFVCSWSRRHWIILPPRSVVIQFTIKKWYNLGKAAAYLNALCILILFHSVMADGGGQWRGLQVPSRSGAQLKLKLTTALQAERGE